MDLHDEQDSIISGLESEIKIELKHLESKTLRAIRDKDKHISFLEKRLRVLRWYNKKLDLYSAPAPHMVKQREVFYCELGQNVGSEQDGRRPVVILQNNVGNAHAKITLVAPITSFQNGSIKTIDDQLYLEDHSSGVKVMRPLRFYDIPIELEPSSKYQIYGVVNISQIRVVSKSRLAQTPVAMVTIENFKKITASVEKNIAIFENDLDTDEE
jgi:mRNA interferase MazF